MQIWQAMLPNLNDSIIGALVEKYDFSGGQIENVARHYAIDTVLYGERADSLEKLLAHCDNEVGDIKSETLCPFSPVWRSISSINKHYDEAKSLYQAYTLEEVVKKLGQKAILRSMARRFKFLH